MAQDVANLHAISGFWTRVRDYGEGAVAYAEQGVLVQGSAWNIQQYIRTSCASGWST